MNSPRTSAVEKGVLAPEMEKRDSSPPKRREKKEGKERERYLAGEKNALKGES